MTIQKFESVNEIWGSDSIVEPGTVIFLDESSMVSIPQLSRLVSLVKEKQCRLVTLGDTDQHHSVERGDGIRILLDSKSIPTVKLTETYRAKVEYLKKTVEELKAGNRESAFDRLDLHGDIEEIQDLVDLRTAAVNKHLEAVRDGKISILCSPVHSEAREAAEIAREILRSEGTIDKEETTVTRLKKVDAEGPELKNPLHYQLGRVVAFHTKAVGGFQPGEKWQINGAPGGIITLQRNGVTKSFNPETKGKWSVYDTEDLALSRGDQVRITEGFNERGKAFQNNEIVFVAAVGGNQILLHDGRWMSSEFVHLDQGMCVTSHASEGITVDQMVGLVPLNAMPAFDAKAFYVMTSRSRYRSVFYTDMKEELRECAIRSGDRSAVYDYVGSFERQLRQTLEMKYPNPTLYEREKIEQCVEDEVGLLLKQKISKREVAELHPTFKRAKKVVKEIARKIGIKQEIEPHKIKMESFKYDRSIGGIGI